MEQTLMFIKRNELSQHIVWEDDNADSTTVVSTLKCLVRDKILVEKDFIYPSMCPVRDFSVKK